MIDLFWPGRVLAEHKTAGKSLDGALAQALDYLPGDVLRANGYPDHERRTLLTRVLFCLFADDAGVWPLGLFEDFLRLHTRPDGSDLGPQLAWLFQILDTPYTSTSTSTSTRCWPVGTASSRTSTTSPRCGGSTASTPT